MGAKGEETRTRLVQATRELVEARGYYGTGLNDVLAASGAPRGSMYFHFPAGKDEMVALALAEAGQDIGALIAGAAESGAPPVDVVRRLLEALGDRMEESGYAKGCPVATVALETAAGHERLRRVCADTYESWQQELAGLLVRHGHDPAGAEATAGTVLALVEGALLLSRVAHSRTPLARAARAAELLLRADPA
ncbi:TetR family transcriptional regulator [Streptomyces sp. TLI_235]|nr:TetR/AcrR family transcriptional regulator [Streptomyces sp. TLI_235]PBC67621.1 TetR family transcriptional regulator [Streptomyces sp. TLI_235]